MANGEMRIARARSAAGVSPCILFAMCVVTTLCGNARADSSSLPIDPPAATVAAMFRAGRYAELVDNTRGCEPGVVLDAERVNRVMLRAISLRRLGRPEEAIVDFDCTVEVVRAFDNVDAAQYGELFYELAELYGEQGDIERALQIVDEGLRIRPRSPTHQILAAYWHETLGRLDEARMRYREVLPTLPPDSEGNVVVTARLGRLDRRSPAAIASPGTQAIRLTPHVLLVPLNDSDSRVNLRDLCVLIEHRLQLRCSVVAPLTIPDHALRTGERLQYDAERVLGVLGQARLPDDHEVFVLALTSRDIFAGDAQYLFSLQDPSRRMALVSSYRLLERLPPYWDPKVLATRRLLIQVLSAIGNGLGLARPRSPQCPLAYPNSVAEFVGKSTRLCESTQTQWRQMREQIGGREARFDQQRLETLGRVLNEYLIEPEPRLEDRAP
jgi:predicted Zn-dependent protease